jgi:hypothetical protein
MTDLSQEEALVEGIVSDLPKAVALLLGPAAMLVGAWMLWGIAAVIFIIGAMITVSIILEQLQMVIEGLITRTMENALLMIKDIREET